MRLTPQLHTQPLPHDFTLAFGPFAPAGPAVLNLAAYQRLTEFRQPQVPVQAVDYTLADCGLLLPAGQEPALAWRPPTTLTAWLHVTNACNLDCPYCYIRKSNARMTEAVGRAAVAATFRSALRNGFQTVKLKYAGGEATLHFRLIQRLHAYAQELARESNLKLEGVILSNGTVWTAAMARWVATAGLRVMISLDGVGAAHDAQRPDRAGQSTFGRVERTVDQLLRPAGLQPTIAATITGRNASALAGLVAWAIERALPFSLNFYRENLLAASQSDLQFEERQIIAGMQAAYRVIEQQLPPWPVLDGLLDRVRLQAHAHTCGVGQNYLVFDHTGRVGQCQMNLGQGVDLADRDDALSLTRSGPIPLVSVEDKEGCRTCLWRYRCAGGCPLETYRATGRFDIRSPHCQIYTTLLPAALRLEGLRLLKKAGYLT
jgi:uncharacterized protein